MSKRIKQVNELIKSVLGSIILKELELPADVVATISKVDTSPDLKNTTVYLSILPDNKTSSTFDIIFKQIGKMQHYLGENITLRCTPRIHLKIDFTEQKAGKIEQILDNLDKKR